MATNFDITTYIANRGFPPPVIKVSQGDTDWAYRIKVLATGAVYAPNVTYAILTGHKPDGHVFAYRGSKSGDYYVFTPSNANGNLAQMTTTAGDVPCELRLINSSRSIGTANFILRVEPGPEGVVTVASASALPAYTTILQELGVLIGKVETLPDDVPGWIGDWLEEHISGGQGVAVDNTLTVQGAAADAKESGDRLRALEGATIETDDTLTVSGAAADAAAVGEILGTGAYHLGDASHWLRQAIHSGQRQASENRLALADYLPTNITHIDCAEGYSSLIYRYSAAGDYIGYWGGSGFVTSGTGVWRQSFDVPDDSYRYVLTLKKTSDAALLPSEAEGNIESDADGEAAAGLIQRVTALENHPSDLSDDVKHAILACFRSVDWLDASGADAYNALLVLWFPDEETPIEDLYDALEYIENPGDAYIVTDISIPLGTSVTATGYSPAAIGTPQVLLCAAATAGSSGGTQCIAYYHIGAQVGAWASNIEALADFSTRYAHKVTIEATATATGLSSSVHDENGNTAGKSATGSISNVGKLVIFRGSGLTTAMKYVGRFYGAEVSNGTSILPYRRKRDGAVGVLDTASRTFYASASATPCIAGPTVES